LQVSAQFLSLARQSSLGTGLVVTRRVSPCGWWAEKHVAAKSVATMFPVRMQEYWSWSKNHWKVMGRWAELVKMDLQRDVVSRENKSMK